MRVSRIIGNITFGQEKLKNDPDAKYRKQKEEAQKRQEEEKLKKQAEWEALINTLHTYRKAERIDGK
jgi:hypothetical protein